LVADVEAADLSILGVVEESNMVGSWEQLETHLRLGFLSTTEGWRTVCNSRSTNLNKTRNFSEPQPLGFLSPPPEEWHAVGNETYDFSEPQRLRRWSVWFNGKNIGQVSTSGWVKSDYHSKSGQLRITSTPIPRVGKRVAAFAGWGDVKKFRPLVALIGMRPGTSKPWTSSKPTTNDIAAVWPVFRQVVPEIPSCKYDQEGRLLRTERPIAQKHLEIFHVIRLDRDEKLFGAHVARRFFKDCDGWGGSASDVWFFSEGNSQPRMISQQPQLDGWDSSQELIDIGDFDGDGRIEALFWFSGYNEDGYVLYFDRFEKSAIFTWGYH
jgi:hypothetical protein